MEQVLLLNITYEPLKIIDWKKAITLLFLGKVSHCKVSGSIAPYHVKLGYVTGEGGRRQQHQTHKYCDNFSLIHNFSSLVVNWLHSKYILTTSRTTGLSPPFFFPIPDRIRAGHLGN